MQTRTRGRQGNTMAKYNQVKDGELEKVKRQVESFLKDTLSARQLSERDRDYYDHKQWTDEQLSDLRRRHQAPIVVNRIRPKVEGLKGLVSIRQSNPKAYPRTKHHDRAAEVITDGLRYVADDNDFPSIKLEVSEDFFVEGYGGAVVDVKQKQNGDIDIKIDRIPWDRIYFDPRSRKRDFSDARFMGFIQWMGKEELAELFPGVDIEKLCNFTPSLDRTFEDRPHWIDSPNKRILVARHYYKKGGIWYMCIFAGDSFLVDPEPSPYLDEEGSPTCNIELVSAYIDRENNRYGEVRGFIAQQDEINHRRSKALFLLSQRQTSARRGAIDDIPSMKRELAKADGHIEYTGDVNAFQILPTTDMVQGQIELYQDAKSELDAVSFNAQLAGERQSGNLSGIAINRLQQAGTTEVNGLFKLLTNWEKRIYRQVWARIKQFWTEEKWIRVTDDQDSLRWVGFNTEVTAQEWLEEQINDESLPITERRKAAAAYQAMVQSQDPRLQQVVDIRNKPAEMNVDIILDQSFDTVNVQEEQFKMLVEFAKGGADIDIIDLIELSQLRGKKELIEKIEQRREQAAQSGSDAAQVKIQSEQAKTQETLTKAEVNKQEAISKKIENVMLISQSQPIQAEMAQSA